ncbi:uncharacterized protein LOC115888740 [Sitophilus oryzae]|uniref:Uncharacterized protein LOC115888740 n=1 Tax=Sitophilus oryzae TaxID=7048 RepID=A0A6J2YMJ3_SITOR|nr:uncharacterized protein LOC115888740 [Sitophilus oryzae]
MELSYNYGENEGKKSVLVHRIYEIKNLISYLREQLILEKKLLEIERHGAGSHDKISVKEPSSTSVHREPSILLDKSNLKEIESKCTTELYKFDEYISNIRQLKSNWIKMRENEKLRKEKYSNDASIPKNPKGRVFYVDSQLY